jgi:hypothetical protein
VPANSPAASGATPVPGVPAGPGTGWGSPAPGPATGTPGGVAPRPALPPAPVITSPGIPPHPGPFRVQRQRSLADMANEQLRRGKPKDPLAQGIESAEVDDCVHAPKNEQQVGGLLALPGLAAKALAGKCPK